MPKAHDLRGSKSERARVSKLLADGYTEADCLAVISSYEREVKADPSKGQWFDAVTPFRPENFSRALARAGPDLFDRPRRDDKRGHAAPSAASEFGDGDVNKREAT